MKHFIVFDAATGKVLRIGQCQDDDLQLQAQAAERVEEWLGENIAADGRWTRAQDGTYTQVDPPAKTPDELAADERNAFNAARRQAYGSIEDQLDLIYHQGLDAWKAKIDEVKTRIPKPILQK